MIYFEIKQKSGEVVASNIQGCANLFLFKDNRNLTIPAKNLKSAMVEYDSVSVWFIVENENEAVVENIASTTAETGENSASGGNTIEDLGILNEEATSTEEIIPHPLESSSLTGQAEPEPPPELILPTPPATEDTAPPADNPETES